MNPSLSELLKALKLTNPVVTGYKIDGVTYTSLYSLASEAMHWQGVEQLLKAWAFESGDVLREESFIEWASEHILDALEQNNIPVTKIIELKNL